MRYTYDVTVSCRQDGAIGIFEHRAFSVSIESDTVPTRDEIKTAWHRHYPHVELHHFVDINPESGEIIPEPFITFASEYHDGVGSMLYAVASTGGVSLGTRRPWIDNQTRPMTDEEWDLSLWKSLSYDVSAAIRVAKKWNHTRDDIATGERFEKYVEEQIAIRRAAYAHTAYDHE